MGSLCHQWWLRRGYRRSYPSQTQRRDFGRCKPKSTSQHDVLPAYVLGHTYSRTRREWGQHGGLEFEKDGLCVFPHDHTFVTGVVSAGKAKLELEVEARHCEGGLMSNSMQNACLHIRKKNLTEVWFMFRSLLETLLS